MTDKNLLGPSAPTPINREYEKNKDEYSVNGISVKDLLATKSTLSREEINWMIAALENCKIHAMGVAKLKTGGINQGFCGASIVSERNLVGVYCHFIRCIDLSAFSPLQSTMVEQQLHPQFSVTYEGSAQLTFSCKQRYISLHFKDHEECKKFYRRTQGCLNNLDKQTTAGNAVSKLKVDNPGIADPNLATTIREAELQRAASKGVDKNKGFLADGLADIIAKAQEESASAKQHRQKRNAPQPTRQKIPQSNPSNYGPGSQRGNMNRGNRGIPNRGTFNRGMPNRGNSQQRGQRGNPNNSRYSAIRRGTISTSSPSITNNTLPRMDRSSTLPSRVPDLASRNLQPRESKVMAWQQKIQRPNPGSTSGEIMVKVKIVKLGAVKTLKFNADTVIYDAIKNIAKKNGLNNAGFGLYRRSGLQLDEDLTFAEQDVITNDILEFRT